MTTRETGKDVHVQRFAKGEFLFKEGEWGDRIYQLRSGEILVFKTGEKGNRIALAKLKPGDMFGEMFLLNNNHTRTASAVAVEESVVNVFFEEAIMEDLKDMPPRLRVLFTGLVEKLNKLNTCYVHELTEIIEEKDAVKHGGRLPKLRPAQEEERDTGISGDRIVSKPVAEEEESATKS